MGAVASKCAASTLCGLFRCFSVPPACRHLLPLVQNFSADHPGVIARLQLRFISDCASAWKRTRGWDPSRTGVAWRPRDTDGALEAPHLPGM